MMSEEFQERLRAAFEFDGRPYGRVFMIHEAELEYALSATKFSDHLSISDGFKACFLEAVELLNTHFRPLVKTPLSEFYPVNPLNAAISQLHPNSYHVQLITGNRNEWP